MKSLSLFPATPEQTIETHRRTHHSWSKGLSHESYQRKESLLQTYSHATQGKMTTWVLAPREDPTTLDFLCSCETYCRTGLAKPSDDGPVEEVACYGIASVYTPAQNRRKGYAKHMMRLLHWVLAPPSSPRLDVFPEAWGERPTPVPGFHNGKFSVLYSDVGPEFYASCSPTLDTDQRGWVVRNPLSTTWKVDASVAPKSKAKWLTIQMVSDVFEAESRRMKAELKAGEYTFLPNNGVGLFLALRTIQARSDEDPVWPLSVWGVALDDETFATWTVDLDVPEPALLLTRIRATEETFPELFSHIQAFASKFDKLKVIEGWNVPKRLQAGAMTKERDDHLPSVIWYGDDTGLGMTWVWNEKFAWC